MVKRTRANPTVRVSSVTDRLGGALTGALALYVAGRIATRVFMGPYGDVWALVQLVCVPAGVLIGLMRWFWRAALIPVGAAIGLYLGWQMRAILTRNDALGPAVEIMFAPAIVGAVVGGHFLRRGPPSGRAALLGAFYGGVTSHFLSTVAEWGASDPGPPLHRAPAVAAGALAGCVIAVFIKRNRAS